MGSNVYILDGRKIPKSVRERLKQERGFSPGQHKRKSHMDSLYLVGKVHAVPSSSVYPGFTLTMGVSSFNRLSDDVPLYSSDMPELKTVGDLRNYMYSVKVEYLLNKNIC